MPDRDREQSLTFIVTATALLVFAAIETWGARLPLTYDEPWYLDAVATIDQRGFATREFFEKFPGPTGPLHAWVHWFAKPLTHLSPPLVRLVNPLLAAIAMWAVASSARMTRGNAPWGSALLMTAIPMSWPCVGLALTEVPAMSLYAAHLMLFVASWSDGNVRSRSIALAILSGAALGLAVLGRQPLLLTLPAVAMCGLLNRRSAVGAGLCCATALVVCVPVFMIWGGLTPQSSAGDVAARTGAHRAVFGIVPWHVIYAMAYAGITTAIVVPRCIAIRRWVWMITLVVTLAVCVLLRIEGQLPLQTVFASLIPPGSRCLAESASSGILLGIALCCGMGLLESAYKHRHDMIVVLGILSVLSQIVAAGAIRHQFSSRYLFAVTPAILVMASRFQPVRTSALRAAIGAAMGAASLISYFVNAAPQVAAL